MTRLRERVSPHDQYAIRGIVHLSPSHIGVKDGWTFFVMGSLSQVMNEGEIPAKVDP